MIAQALTVVDIGALLEYVCAKLIDDGFVVDRELVATALAYSLLFTYEAGV